MFGATPEEHKPDVLRQLDELEAKLHLVLDMDLRVALQSDIESARRNADNLSDHDGPQHVQNVIDRPSNLLIRHARYRMLGLYSQDEPVFEYRQLVRSPCRLAKLTYSVWRWTVSTDDMPHFDAQLFKGRVDHYRDKKTNEVVRITLKDMLDSPNAY